MKSIREAQPAWLEPLPSEVPADWTAAIGGHPLVARALRQAQRGLVDLAAVRAFMDVQAYTPAPPTELPGMAAAVERLLHAIRRGEKICVWGDFDVDGQTSTTLLVSALRLLGAVVNFHIPLREVESHGVNLPMLDRLLSAGAELLLTCDTGISAQEAVEYAAARGVDCVITDHHDLPAREALPAALALVNPKFLQPGHPLASLPGVGVAYKLAEALFAASGRAGRGACDQFLDLAALGIVADVAVLQGDTRYLLQRGLDVLRSAPRLGVRAMLELANVNPIHLSEEHIGFLLAPQLNALGRLSDANGAVDFLTTADLGRARTLALQLAGLNEKRKLLTQQVLRGALAQLEADPTLLNLPVIILAHPSWPGGVIGIVAGRLVERYQKPVLMIATPAGESAHGSARSVAGINITAALAASQQWLSGFGGHPMAAGFGLPVVPDLPAHLAELRHALSQAVRAQAGGVTPRAGLQIDGYLPLSEVNLELAQDFERLAPFGAGNPPLILVAHNCQIISHKALDRKGEHLALVVEDDQDVRQPVVWWQGGDWELPPGRFDLAYRLRTSTYGGERAVQVEWVDARLVEAEAAVTLAAAPTVTVIDHRHAMQPRQLLQELLTQAGQHTGTLEGALVWCEGEAKEQVAGCDRTELKPARSLVVWTCPPGAEELQEALGGVSPERIILFAEDPGLDTPAKLLSRLAGLVKYSLAHHQGVVSVRRLAAATGQREAVVRVGISWLEARGHVCVVAKAIDELTLELGEGRPVDRRSLVVNRVSLEAALESLLEETRAYRAYYARVDPGLLTGAL